MKREYHRHLPHQVTEGFPIFLTWNLKGAIPKAVIMQLQRERHQLEREPPRVGEALCNRSIRHAKILFARADQFLDNCHSGPLILREHRLAQVVEDAIVLDAGTRYQLWAWCVMANHVHVLLTPDIELAAITQRLKGGTAYKINLLQEKQGRTVWQDESYDHWARDNDEMLRIIDYIENNPVKAKLCAKPSEWNWSSARFRDRWPVGEPYVGQA